MINDPSTKATYARAIGKWILGKQVSIYLRGRSTPMTGLTVCQVQDTVIIARWNSSTHLIPTAQVICIRFSPDSEPCRNTTHPLNRVVRHNPICRTTED